MKPAENMQAAQGVAAARWAISAIFLLNGAGIGLWAAHVPEVQARAGIDTGVLGFLLLTIAGGAVAAMPLSGWLSGHWGTRAVALGSAGLFALTSVLLMNVEGTTALFLGLLGLLCFAVEGALVDWSALLLTERTRAEPASAALGYSAFSVAMAACRFAGDRLVLRFGAPRMMVYGGLGMFGGLMLAVLSTHFVLSALGFALIGLSAANVVPVIFAAAARMPGMSAGGGLATVATLGYAGLLMAPPLIGSIAAHTDIAVALGVLSLSGLVIAANARIVKKT